MNSELKKKILYTLLILLLYRVGTFIFIPGISRTVISDFFNSDTGSIFNLINMFSGGAFARMSIFALNIMPYITASIIIHLLCSAYKGLGELRKDGAYGRKKINQYTVYLTLFISVFQALGIYFGFSNTNVSIFISDSPFFLWTTMFSLVAGTMIVLWFGNKITQNGIGNGISLIIFIGVVSEFPSSFLRIFEMLRKGNISFLFFFFVIFIFVSLILSVVYMEKSVRRVKIQYPNRVYLKMKDYNSEDACLPLRVNVAGVMPPIFATSLLVFPIIISKLFKTPFAEKFSVLFTRGSITYMLVYVFLIIFFCYFYAAIAFNTEEVSENFKKSNCFIPGIRPGLPTKKYLDYIVNRITFFGAVCLSIICLLPEFLTVKYHLPQIISGVGLFIVVDTVIELVGQIQSYMYSDKYKSFTAWKKIKVR